MEAEEDFPDFEVTDMSERDYMTFAFVEDLAGPLYYKLRPTERKRKRSDSSSDDDETRNEE